MPNIKSAKKRVLVNAKQSAENASFRSSMKNGIKKYTVAITEKNIELAEKLLPEIVALIGKACTKGVIHKNTASRKVSHVSKALSQLKTAE